MFIYVFGGYIFVILFIVLFCGGISKAHDKLFYEGFVPTMTNPEQSTERQKIMAVTYLLWFIVNTIWLLFVFVMVIANL